MGGLHLFQIFYDAATRTALDPGFTPLDNTRNERPDWYELWVIRNHLHRNPPGADDWYGFFSPGFRQKTGVTSREVGEFMEFARDKVDAALILCAWDQVAYFQNPFEQGEVWHPGITALSQAMLTRLGEPADLAAMVTHSGNFTFANFIIGKARYWQRWLQLADSLFDLVETDQSPLGASLRQTTSYGSDANQAPVKAFIQERLPALILADKSFRTATMNTSDAFPIYDRLFVVDEATRGVLQTCDALKKKYRQTGDPKYVTLFKEVRRLVGTRFTLPAGSG